MKKTNTTAGLKLAALLLNVLTASTLFLAIQVQAETQNMALIQTQTSTQAKTQRTEQYYISPLQLGLHTQASFDSPIKELISSGVAVEVIKSDQEFTQIKTLKGSKGWIKNKFLTQKEPASLRVEKMQEALLRAQQFMKNRLQGEQAKNTLSNPEGSQLSENEKAFYKETISGLKEELKAWEQLDRQDKQAQREHAEKNIRVLKSKLAQIATLAAGQKMNISDVNLSSSEEFSMTKNNIVQTLLKLIKKNYILFLMVAGLSFLLGLFLMDLINRRRHGGYRI